MNDEALEQLLAGHPNIWRGNRGPNRAWPTLSTGHAELDAALPGGGWPLGALVEIMATSPDAGELRLVLPVMAAISKFRWVAFITPPHQPYPPGLQQAGIELRHLLVVCAQAAADVSWSLEKLLRSGHCGMALAWPQRLSDHQTRRLQLATETGNALTVLFPRQASQTSHAAVRLSANPVADGLVLNILKARGRLSRESVVVRT